MENKKWTHSLWVKTLLFVLVIVSFTSTINLFFNMAKKSYDISMTKVEEYKKSDEYYQEYTPILYNLNSLLIEYKNEDYIKDPKNISEIEILEEEEELFNNFKYGDDYGGEYVEISRKNRRYNHELTEEENLRNFKEIYSDELDSIEDKIIDRKLREYKSKVKELESLSTKDGRKIYYYGSKNGQVYKNKDLNKEDMNKYYSYISSKEGIDYNFYYKPYSHSTNDDNYELIIAMDNDYFMEQERDWNIRRNELREDLKDLSIQFSATVILFLILGLLTGRKYFGDKEIELNFLDRIYTDVNILMCILTIFMWFLFLDNILIGDYRYSMGNVVTGTLGSFGLALVLSLIRKAKNASFFSHSLLGKIFLGVKNFFKDLFNSSKTGHKLVFLMILYPILILITFFMFPVTIGVCIYFVLKRVKDYEKIKDGVDRVKDGELDYKIEIEREGEFKDLAENINRISDGLKNAVDNELKSERLKAELITNVSHDIRTPLTSIISYVDLLKDEDDEEKRKEYIEILENKSHRLKTLTEDLFEASKASSGNIPVNLEEVDIVALVNQGIGEIDDSIRENNLEFILNSKDQLVLKADGELLWRSLDNIFANIFKYAMKGSRVYIDILELENTGKIIIKNISAYELNISEDELMERFKRGDESRTSEGSGLGLSIVKSLVELQRGSFYIEIDGDLFKAIIELPKK